MIANLHQELQSRTREATEGGSYSDALHICIQLDTGVRLKGILGFKRT